MSSLPDSVGTEGSPALSGRVILLSTAFEQQGDPRKNDALLRRERRVVMETQLKYRANAFMVWLSGPEWHLNSRSHRRARRSLIGINRCAPRACVNTSCASSDEKVLKHLAP